MNIMPGNELPQLPPQPIEPHVLPEAIQEPQMSRRDMLRLLRSAAVVTGATVAAPGLIAPESADAQPETEESPAPESQSSSETSNSVLNKTTSEDTGTEQPLTPEEREKVEAETENLEADTELKKERA